MRFRSRIDLWLGVLLVAVTLIDLALLADIVRSGLRPEVNLAAGAVALLSVLLIGWILLGTWYEVGDERLRVACGPMRWTVPLADITAVVPTRSPWSAPALSLSRLRVEYDPGRSVVVSPRDADGFRAALRRGGARIDGGQA